jgi:hypothetical protein
VGRKQNAVSKYPAGVSNQSQRDDEVRGSGKVDEPMALHQGPPLAPLRHARLSCECPYTGVNRKWPNHRQNDAFDPFRKSAISEASERLDELLELGTDLLCRPLQPCIVNGLHRCNGIDCCQPRSFRLQHPAPRHCKEALSQLCLPALVPHGPAWDCTRRVCGSCGSRH